MHLELSSLENSIAVKMPFPMPNLKEQFAQLAGNAYFSQLDLRMRYHQVAVCELSNNSQHL